MKLTPFQMGMCALVMITLLFSSGCIFPSGGNTPAPSTTITTPSTVKVTSAVSAAPTSTALPALPSATTDPWSQFVEPTESPTTTGTNKPGVTVTETSEPTVTETPVVEETLTEVPTTIPEIVVPLSCSRMGGNVCMANETCSGAFVKTTDENQCCAGVCEPTK